MSLAALFLASLAALAAWRAHLGYRDLHQRVETAHTRLDAEPPDLSDVRAAINALDGRIDHVDRGITDAHERIDEQTVAIAEGIERVDRSERRVRAAVQRAQRRMEEAGFIDEGVQAEAEQLRFDDAPSGRAEGVPSVHGGVANGRTLDPSIFPGDWS